MSSSFRQIEKKRMVKITELRSESVLREAFPILRELHHQLDEQRYTELLVEMMPNGYRLFALRDGGRIAAVASVQILTILYYGRHLYVYDLVSTPSVRSKGSWKSFWSTWKGSLAARGVVSSPWLAEGSAPRRYAFTRSARGVQETRLLHAEGPTLMLFRRVLAYSTRKRAGVALVGDWPAGSNGCLAC
jgi:hypothetical protein